MDTVPIFQQTLRPLGLDVVPCATGTEACFVTRTVDAGEELERLSGLYGLIVL